MYDIPHLFRCVIDRLLKQPKGSAEMKVRWELLAGAALIAASIILTNHWQIGVASAQIYRLDRWSGSVTACNVPPGGNGNMALFSPGADIPCKAP